MRISYKKWTVYSLGDHAIVFALSPIVCKSIATEIGAFNEYIKSKSIAGIQDIIPAYHTLTLIIDIIQFEASGDNGLEVFCIQLLSEFEKESTIKKNDSARVIQVPVCYDIEFGIDLTSLSTNNKLSIQEIIEIHCAELYTVYCIGFLPGFAYMGSVPKSIQIPRHASPRHQVPAGSVGIAGVQTGIYPSNSPGGWQIIGRTPIKIFDPHPSQLALFKMGDQVQFYPISIAAFHDLNQYS